MSLALQERIAALANAGQVRAILRDAPQRRIADLDEDTLDGTSDIGPRERELFERMNVRMDDWWGWQLRVRESIIAIGQAVTVVGSGVREPDLTQESDQPYRGEARTRLRLSGSPHFPLIVSETWGPLAYRP